MKIGIAAERCPGMPEATPAAAGQGPGDGLQPSGSAQSLESRDKI